jgi:hypothetical protein
MNVQAESTTGREANKAAKRAGERLNPQGAFGVRRLVAALIIVY